MFYYKYRTCRIINLNIWNMFNYGSKYLNIDYVY